MGRKRRIRRGRGSGRWQLAGGIGLIALVLVVLFAGFFIFYDTRQSHVELDKITNCPLSGPVSVTAVLLDTSDPMNLVQRTDLMNELETRLSVVPRFGALEIYAVAPLEDAKPEPLFRKCNPGRATEINSLTGNPTMVEREWRDGFREPVEKVLARMLSADEADTSPILESIQWVTINALTAPGRASVPRKLIVVSDFLQHTRNLSHYKGIPDFVSVAATPFYRRVRAPLQDVSIEMLVLQRQVRRDPQALLTFWKSYFDAQGVKALRVVDLAG